MPPKKNTVKNKKSDPPAKAGRKTVEKKAKDGEKMVLRKNPKKKVSDDFEQGAKDTVRTSKKVNKSVKANPTPDSDSSFEGVTLTTAGEEGQFESENSITDTGENCSSNAVMDTNRAGNSADLGGENSIQPGLNAEISQQVSAAMSQYFEQRKKRKVKKRKRKHRRISSSESDDSSSSEESSESEGSSYSSDSAREKKRVRKRKRKSDKKRKRREKKGEKRLKSLIEDSPSVSTVYTRGCKSPQRAVITESSDDSLDGGDIDSETNTENFVESLNSSHDRSTPFVDRRRSRSRSPRGRSDQTRGHGDGNDRGRREADPHAERFREQADEVIRDLQQNKADLAKPSGELQIQLASLLRDFKHFHLTSHVDKKLKETILSQDFTIDFRRLLPRSRAKMKYDSRMQVVHQDGATFFVPAGEREIKDILSYKTWEIAFKIFMGIFNEKWPDRMNELLQYSHIIQTASQNHPWECVYNYDISFREIMSEQPNTHWGVISQQTWSLQLGEGNVKTSPPTSFTHERETISRESGRSRNPCWKFNKGRCTHGDKCEFDHRCSHCGKRGHGKHECYKRLKGDKEKHQGRDNRKDK